MTVLTEELITQHGLTMEEYAEAEKILGRPLNMLELGLFSAMWSEHCSYKSSRTHLSTFPTEGPQVIEGPGENAGVVDIGDGYAVVFKMESHNHPSYIEPYQGAATGVGGILRDVFTMGARPIASLNLLRFGEPSHAKTKFLVDGVVAGIAGYGNCIGVPTVGGEVVFNKSYNGNNLVNAFNLGLVKKDKIFLGRAEGIGNPVMYVGSRTGRDGIHGATMASEEFSDATEEKRPTVQVGDPFTEKLLVEACLELFKTDYVVGIQDMGAAGMTSTSFEMAGRSGSGVEIDLDKVPRREEAMTPYEIMLSESQERMLLVCHKGCEQKIIDIFEKWDLAVATIGRVTSDGFVRLMEKGEVVAEVPAAPLSEKSPVYHRPIKAPAQKPVKIDPSSVNEPTDYVETFQKLLGSLNLCSKEWVYSQYDHMVRTNTVTRPGSDAAVVKIKGTRKGIAMSVDCNSRYCALNPYEGGKQAVAESCRNVAAAGARPLAITDCLNFGSPEIPEVMWQFTEAIRGMSEACIALDAPVVSGNVSFYNQTGEDSVHPTPAVGAVGLLEDVSLTVTRYFKDEGDIILLLGDTFDEVGGSEYLATIHGREEGIPPKVDLGKERKLHELMIALAEQKLVKSMTDVSGGGLLVTLANCTFDPKAKVPLGFTVSFDTDLRPDFFLFSESQSRAIVTCRSVVARDVIEIARALEVPVHAAGEVTFKRVQVEMNGQELFTTVQPELLRPWQEALPNLMQV